MSSVIFIHGLSLAKESWDSGSPAAVDAANSARGPLLMVAASRDHTVPEATTRAAFDLYSESRAVTDLHVLPDRGHSFSVDRGWRAVADDALFWLSTHGLAPESAAADVAS